MTTKLPLLGCTMVRYKANNNGIRLVKTIQRKECCGMHTHFYIDYNNDMLSVSTLKEQ